MLLRLAGLFRSHVFFGAIDDLRNGKIVIVLEGADASEIGARMIEISLMDGVLAANLVFEQIDDSEEVPT